MLANSHVLPDLTGRPESDETRQGGMFVRYDLPCIVAWRGVGVPGSSHRLLWRSVGRGIASHGCKQLPHLVALPSVAIWLAWWVNATYRQ